MLLLSTDKENIPNSTVILKWYDDETKKIVYTREQFKPYCYTKTAINLADIKSIPVKKHDLLQDKEIEMYKNTAKNTTIFGYDGQKIPEKEEGKIWEIESRVDELYLRENHLICGLENGGKDNKHVLKSCETTRPTWDNYVEEWKNTLSEDIPEIPRIAVDIEVETHGVLPDPVIAEEKITCISIAGDINFVFILDEKKLLKRTETADYTLIPFISESNMILEAFKHMQNRTVLTFNGDLFDIPYMTNRLERLTDKKISPEMLHLDLWKIYSTPAIKIYVYPRKYTYDSLDEISRGILGRGKVEFDVLNAKTDSVEGMMNLAKYCWHDSQLTHELTTIDDSLFIKILIIFSRMCRIPMERIGRTAVSNWTKSMLYHEHARYNFLIPNKHELKERSQGVKNESKDKKYKGATVVTPESGIYFNVTVLDFASLYPSIVKTNNISYETVRCPHEECQKNTIPLTNHWYCGKYKGLETLLVGTLRDLRVEHFKRQKDHTSKIITGAMKVFLNASYGVMGADKFPLYFLPAAEATTAYGRHIINGTIEDAKSLDIDVLYGDTDSVFLRNIDEEQVNQMIKSSKDRDGVDLEVDKVYRYIALSGRKKNYFGVLDDGSVDIKGLMGKKSNTPQFIKNLFKDITDILKDIQTEDEFPKACETIKGKITRCFEYLQRGKIPLDQLAFHATLSKNLSEYTVASQHIKAARLLDHEPKIGETITYIKTDDELGVQPLEIADINNINTKKYIEATTASLTQLLEPFGIEIVEPLPYGQTTLF